MGKKQKAFNRILDDLCKVQAELSLASIDASLDNPDSEEAHLYDLASRIVESAIELVDPGCNPKFMVITAEIETVKSEAKKIAKEVKHGKNKR